jgi:hypothetical protein
MPLMLMLMHLPRGKKVSRNKPGAMELDLASLALLLQITFFLFYLQEIGQLHELTCLDISENRLEDIPFEISGLRNLTDLHLSQNSIEFLPDSIGDLPKLTIFKIDQNQLAALNFNIGRCYTLQVGNQSINYYFKMFCQLGVLICIFQRFSLKCGMT